MEMDDLQSYQQPYMMGKTGEKMKKADNTYMMHSLPGCWECDP